MWIMKDCSKGLWMMQVKFMQWGFLLVRQNGFTKYLMWVAMYIFLRNVHHCQFPSVQPWSVSVQLVYSHEPRSQKGQTLELPASPRSASALNSPSVQKLIPASISLYFHIFNVNCKYYIITLNLSRSPVLEVLSSQHRLHLRASQCWRYQTDCVSFST